MASWSPLVIRSLLVGSLAFNHREAGDRSLCKTYSEQILERGLGRAIRNLRLPLLVDMYQNQCRSLN